MTNTILLEALFAFLVLAAGVWYWQDSLRNRETILMHARRVCNEHQLQFLDQSVHVKNFKLSRDESSRLFIRRFYAFEFSINGADRYYGVAVVGKAKVEYLSLLHPDGEIIEGSLPT